MKRAILLQVALAVVSSGCAGPRTVATALSGDLASLKQAIQAAQKSGDLDAEAAKDVAEAVARRELRSSQGEVAVERVHAMRACVGAVADELREKAKRLDNAGAEAALLLAESGRTDPEDLFATYHDAESAAWRAVAARIAVGSEYTLQRSTWFRDVDERVRRAALRAAREAADPGDLGGLLEAARLDPDPLSRSLALQAIGRIGDPQGVTSLRDLWARAQDQERQGIAEAWADLSSLGAGGERELLWVVETQSGLARLVAAAALVRVESQQAPVGAATLQRALSEGTTDERRLALHLSPLPVAGNARFLPEFRRAAESEDRAVAVMALARLLHVPAERGGARRYLRTLASRADDVGQQALAALAADRDLEVKALLVAQLRDVRAPRRRLAALGLIFLGDFSAAAAALADDSPAVRSAVACRMLASGG